MAGFTRLWKRRMCIWHPRERGNDPKLKRDGKKQRKETLGKKKKNSNLLVCETP
jgi:hypothetical protein